MEMLLEQRELLDLGETLQGVKIVCQHGQCWITQSGDSRDHILRRGGNFIIRAKGQVIITATESCRIVLVESNKAANLQTHYKDIYNKFIRCPITQKNV